MNCGSTRLLIDFEVLNDDLETLLVSVEDGGSSWGGALFDSSDDNEYNQHAIHALIEVYKLIHAQDDPVGLFKGPYNDQDKTAALSGLE